mmetsp:Transcript_63705/g.168691  ORF Transcript_63705/g.168691 Transcript_63705/m.168691 type:complete len:233 (+) Transcript_63705:582-1280(+)
MGHTQRFVYLLQRKAQGDQRLAFVVEQRRGQRLRRSGRLLRRGSRGRWQGFADGGGARQPPTRSPQLVPSEVPGQTRVTPRRLLRCERQVLLVIEGHGTPEGGEASALLPQRRLRRLLHVRPLWRHGLSETQHLQGAVLCRQLCEDLLGLPVKEPQLRAESTKFRPHVPQDVRVKASAACAALAGREIQGSPGADGFLELSIRHATVVAAVVETRVKDVDEESGKGPNLSSG